MLSRTDDAVTLQAPATIGNFGPGFDVSSLALQQLGDRIELARADEDVIHVKGPGSVNVPEAWSQNLAGATLDHLREATGVDQAYKLTLHKPRKAGSGLGSSASSAAGAALAFHGLNPDLGLAPEDLIHAAGLAEGGGRPHYDDVAAVVLGGLALVRPGGQRPEARRVTPPADLHLAIAVPDLEVETSRMRQVLPEAVPLVDAVANLGAVATLVDAFHRGDVATIGACLDDRLAVPYRSEELAFYPEARQAGLDAGGLGVTLCGSGPAMVAACGEAGQAGQVARAMTETIEDHGTPAEAVVARPEEEIPYDAL